MEYKERKKKGMKRNRNERNKKRERKHEKNQKRRDTFLNDDYITFDANVFQTKLNDFIVSPDFVAFLIKKVRIPIIKALRLFLSHFWVTHVIIVHVCKKKNKLKWLNKCPNFRKN